MRGISPPVCVVAMVAASELREIVEGRGVEFGVVCRVGTPVCKFAVCTPSEIGVLVE